VLQVLLVRRGAAVTLEDLFVLLKAVDSNVSNQHAMLMKRLDDAEDNIATLVELLQAHVEQAEREGQGTVSVF
jgi:hypothetical protein